MNPQKLLLSGLAAGGALLLTQLASAQGVDEFGAYGGSEHGKSAYETPQNAAFELRFGPYYPNVDDEFNGAATPFRNTFGNDTRWMVGFEVDWQLLKIPHFGTLGPGFGWGYTHFSADAPLADGTGTSDQEVTFNVMPMYLVGVLRADVLAKETPVPLVPYAKAGLGYALWWSTDGESTSRDSGGSLGRGSSYGYQVALGGMLLLDVLDAEAAVLMDSSTGVNNSYFFVEWYYSNLDGFGNNKLQVGANTFFFGLALEM